MTDVVRQQLSLLNNRLGRHEPLVLVVVSVTSTYIILKAHRFMTKSEKSLWQRFKSAFFSQLRRLPAVKKKIEAEMAPTLKSIEHSIHDCDESKEFMAVIPAGAKSVEQIVQKAAEYSSMNKKFDYKTGKISGAIYTDIGDEQHIEVLTKIFQTYAFSNPLHPDIFPGARKMEAEVVRMVASLFHGDEKTCGTMTSGGTESIFLACFAHRNRANAKGIEDPIIVVPVTAHAAFEKAAHILGIRIRKVKVNDDGRVCMKAFRSAVTSEACMLVGSAPNFPTGTVDPIDEIAQLGEKYDIPVHVDACLGGFLIPFMEENDFMITVFDFRLKGVSSISCDTHKYGYCPKGSSTIIYRSTEYLHHQYFSITDWPGGIYATPTLAGSRAGLNIALTWATLIYFGRDQYSRRAKEILEFARYFSYRVPLIPGLKLVGSPDVSVVAFRSDEYNIYAVGDALNAKGWNLNALQMPDAIHFCLTYNQARKEVIDKFLQDLKTICAEVSSRPDKGGKSDTAAIYGVAGSVPDKSLVDDVTYAYLDTCYAAPKKH
ncbi:unnamed protein product [Bursaphelenchus okinawaensis]|uniref:sphinganine-1-phosphate aldolase n=1 Tax=Bursaphelenchus okinawaensis TaxID=465554 RepID=A0A811LL35_9BILA|nr:unnamed protein product [Bursaphelenchus okinawaensis]CAG9125072.1 unnamed protein product [Bursaphelenchus okinawaensis]